MVSKLLISYPNMKKIYSPNIHIHVWRIVLMYVSYKTWSLKINKKIEGEKKYSPR